jgi:hypothetical protein
MSELLKPITRHDICSAINAASNERFVPYSVHADLKAKYEKALSALNRIVNSLDEKGPRVIAANTLAELGEN